MQLQYISKDEARGEDSKFKSLSECKRIISDIDILGEIDFVMNYQNTVCVRL